MKGIEVVSTFRIIIVHTKYNDVYILNIQLLKWSPRVTMIMYRMSQIGLTIRITRDRGITFISIISIVKNVQRTIDIIVVRLKGTKMQHSGQMSQNI